MNDTTFFSYFPVDNKSTPLIGRDEVLKTINQLIISSSNNISIVGDTKIGKSSLLKSIENHFLDDINYGHIIPVYINFQEFAYDITGEMFLDRILRKVYRSCIAISEEFKNYPWGKSHEFSEVIEFCKFENIIILLLLDHFDYIPTLKKLDNDFWTHLRSNAQEKGLSIVTASRSGLETLCHKGDIVSSHFWNSFNPIISLSVFEDSNYSIELLSRRISNQKIQNLILKYIGNHPCYLKVAGNTIIKNNFTEFDNEETIINSLFEELMPYYDKCLRLLVEDEKNVDNGVHYKLEYITTLNSILSSNIADSNEKKEIKNLKKLGYIQTNANGFLEIISPLFERYLKIQFNDNKTPESYFGNDPYIFVSYAHSDSKTIFPIIYKLQKEGYRVWYDEGIPTSVKWKKEIEQRIENCNKFIFFLSKGSCISNEVNIELQKCIEFSGRGRYIKDFVMIVLDEIRLCKTEGTTEFVDFVISDCNGLHISKDEERFFNKLTDKLGSECKD